MNETVHNLVNAIAAGDALETQNAFAAAMAEKLSTRLDTMRAEVAQSMFTAPDNVVTEQVNEINEESDAALEMAHRVASKNKNIIQDWTWTIMGSFSFFPETLLFFE